MGKDKLSVIIGKHLVADAELERRYLDSNDPKSYTEKITNLSYAGELFLQMGMYQQAIHLFREAHVLNKKDFWATYHLGSICLEFDKPEWANYYYTVCFEESPPDWTVRPMLLTNYSSVQFKLGDFEGAESSLKEAVNLNPSLDKPYYMGAIHKIYLKQFEEARGLIKRGLENCPESISLKHLELDIPENDPKN